MIAPSVFSNVSFLVVGHWTKIKYVIANNKKINTTQSIKYISLDKSEFNLLIVVFLLFFSISSQRTIIYSIERKKNIIHILIVNELVSIKRTFISSYR